MFENPGIFEDSVTKIVWATDQQLDRRQAWNWSNSSENAQVASIGDYWKGKNITKLMSNLSNEIILNGTPDVREKVLQR